MALGDLRCRRARSDDWPAIWPIFRDVVAAGDTYPFLPDTPEPVARELWMQPGTDRRFTYVAEGGDAILATAYLKPNAIGLGDHVCNAGWMVAPSAGGQGIGRRLAEHVIAEAEALGFAGMQFNAVVATNTRAIRLWESMGFEIVGTVPDAFRHAGAGLTSIHVMYRSLSPRHGHP
jgi:L-amino acid N-acyltransferase YncA